MAARTFIDSGGTEWEVFEVRRTSQKAEAVSPGLEQGWLAFVSVTGKRRLAPFPQDWQSADLKELERLCGIARVSRAGSLSGSGASTPALEPRTRVPRVRPAHEDHVDVAPGELPVEAAVRGEDSVEWTVREFARQARAKGLPAIEAMVRLKTLLTRVFTDPSSTACDLRAVRRWFVEAYYFDREEPRPGPDAQSL